MNLFGFSVLEFEILVEHVVLLVWFVFPCFSAYGSWSSLDNRLMFDKVRCEVRLPVENGKFKARWMTNFKCQHIEWRPGAVCGRSRCLDRTLSYYNKLGWTEAMIVIIVVWIRLGVNLGPGSLCEVWVWHSNNYTTKIENVSSFSGLSGFLGFSIGSKSHISSDF